MVKQDNLDIFDIRIIYDISRQADNFIPQTVVRRKQYVVLISKINVVVLLLLLGPCVSSGYRVEN